MQKPLPRYPDPIARVDKPTRIRDAYQDVVLKMHELARTLEALGEDNFAVAARVDADAYHVRMKLNLRKVETANDNGGSHETH
jgi:hypothetical protein